MFIFFAALRLVSIDSPQDLHFTHLSCMHVLVQNELYPTQSAGIEISEASMEINKDIIAPKKPSQIPVARKDYQIVRTAFHRFKR